MSEYPRLVADLGGTHCRFAIIEQAAGPLLHTQTFIAASYPTLEAVLADYLHGLPLAPESACLAVAGPSSGSSMIMTNLGWRAQAEALQQRFKLRHVLFINDFQAIAQAIPALAEGDSMAVGAGTVDLGQPACVLGPGTGLGVALLIPDANSPVAIATEGGHTALSANTDREAAVFAYWRQKSQPLTRESFLSGPGLLRIYSALCGLDGLTPATRHSPDIQTLAEGGDNTAGEAIALFCALLGSAAGDQALSCGARGGVFLAGGILPALREFLLTSEFRARFENKPPMQTYLRAIGTRLILADNPGLLGAAHWPF